MKSLITLILQSLTGPNLTPHSALEITSHLWLNLQK
jgi:hypothetical protein